jgi:hypothetical protein
MKVGTNLKAGTADPAPDPGVRIWKPLGYVPPSPEEPV